uniref:hypothetical protein n=1 Tax=Klebsiella aerogenes TaxID=548 RepID=UPI001969E3DB
NNLKRKFKELTLLNNHLNELVLSIRTENNNIIEFIEIFIRLTYAKHGGHIKFLRCSFRR